VSLVGPFVAPDQFYRSYLIAYLFWLGLPLGCLALALLYHLSGGAWGAVLLRFLEAGAWTIMPLAALFVPLLFGMNRLYPWTHAEVVSADPLLQHKSSYLNISFFVIRAAIYFAIWIALTSVTTRWSLELDRTLDPASARRLQRFSALGLLLVGLTMTFASIDWIMSLEPHWYSAIYGVMVAMGYVLAAFAFVVAVVAGLARRPPLADAVAVSPRLFNDLGSLLLAFVLLWAYLAFSQYLILWSGNLREEVAWYVQRQQSGWGWVALAVIVFNFILPFLLLLSRDLKRSARFLAVVAASLVVIHFVEILWLVAPAFDSPAFSFSWLDVTLPIGVGGLWLAAFLWRLQQHPLLPRFDRRASPQTEVDHRVRA
jgi:hypothetical protein